MEFLKNIIEKAKAEGIIKNVVGAVIMNENNEVLILERKKDDFMGGIDELPSGNLEIGETILDGMLREVKEETNLDVKNIVKYINSFDYVSGSGKKARQYNFLVEVNSIENIMLTEHDSYKWQSIEEAIKNEKITDEVKFVLEIVNFNKN